MIYLDNAATTPVDPRVSRVIYDSLQNDFANPSSLYDIGAKSEFRMNKARHVIRDSLKARDNEIHFTASASESNNIAIYGLALARKHWGKRIITTGYEHPAVRYPFEFLAEQGFEPVYIDPEEDGTVDAQKIIDAVDSTTCLVCLIHINNETGAIIDIERVAKAVKRKNKRCAVHVDATQSFMKYELNVMKLSIDTMSFSAQKINGPKGIGGLYARSGVNIKTVFAGGGQEGGLRSGTENTAYIQGFAKAVEIHKDEMKESMEKYLILHDRLLDGLSAFDNVVINSPENSAPFTVNFSFLGYRSETLLHFLDSLGICVSSGSACSRGSDSHTLESMHLAKNRVDSALRVSFGPQNTERDVDALIDGLRQARERLQKVNR